jgi:hypothetical protein
LDSLSVGFGVCHVNKVSKTFHLEQDSNMTVVTAIDLTTYSAVRQICMSMHTMYLYKNLLDITSGDKCEDQNLARQEGQQKMN